jgi:hypothetical protein
MATDCKGSGGLCTIVACRWARPGSSEPGARVVSVADGVHPVTSASPVAAGGVLGVARLPVSDNTQTSSPHPIPNSPVRKYPRDKWPLGARRPVPDGVIVGRVVGAHFGGVGGRDSRNGPRRATDGGHLDAHLGVTRCPPRLFEDELGRLVRIRVHAVAQPFTDDLADPGVVVPLAVNALRVQLVGEVGVDIGVRRRGARE